MLVTALVVVMGTVPMADAATWDGFANAWIASHAMRVKGKAPNDRRLSCEGDLNGDGQSDYVVVYTIVGVGGGDDWTQYATALTAAPQGYAATTPIAVGSKADGAVERCRIASAAVELHTEAHPNEYYVLKGAALTAAPAPSPSPR